MCNDKLGSLIIALVVIYTTVNYYAVYILRKRTKRLILRLWNEMGSEFDEDSSDSELDDTEEVGPVYDGDYEVEKDEDEIEE